MVEGVVSEPTKIGVKLKADNCDIAYPPVFQVGGGVARLLWGGGMWYCTLFRRPPALNLQRVHPPPYTFTHSPAASLT